jgi:hypothetical protein
MRPKNKILVSGTIDPEVFQALCRYCQVNPSQSRSAIMSLALRQFLSPEHQEERQRVVAENLDRLYWHAQNHAKRMNQELRVIREMLALFVRTFYNHTPGVPEDRRDAAAADGQARFVRFLEILAEHAGDGPSALELMPELTVVEQREGLPHDESLFDFDQSEAAGKPEEANGQSE